jgi:hypothetical protein
MRSSLPVVTNNGSPTSSFEVHDGGSCASTFAGTAQTRNAIARWRKPLVMISSFRWVVPSAHYRSRQAVVES